MRRLFLQQHQKYRLLLLIGDLLIIIGSFSLIIFLEAYEKKPFSLDISNIVAIYFIIILITTVVFYILDLYDLSKSKGFAIILLSIFLGLGIVITIYSALAYFIILLRPGKINLVLFILITIICTFAWRISYKKLIKLKPQRLLFIGKTQIIKDIRQIIQSKHGQDYIIGGYWHSHSHNPTLPDLFNFIHDHNIDTIVYSVRSKMARQISNDLITIQFSNKHIVDAYNFYQYLTRKYPIYSLDDLSLLVNAQKEVFFPGIAIRMKRAFDILFSLILLPPAFLFLLISALAIKLDSAGPILFIQERLGQNEVPFRLYKLRTMIHNAEKLSGPQWSKDNDPRITRVGWILRKLRLDELPQLFNIFKGEMAVVGPRPIRRHFADLLAEEVPYYRLRFLTKPGLTGWAQVNHDYAGSKEGQSEKLQYDLFYLVHQSMWLDLLILFKTIKVMVWGKGT
jgi:exopolysaccharide biosynthesis polyprenyl glycosylphosphotransferase